MIDSFCHCTSLDVLVVQLHGVWLYDYSGNTAELIRVGILWESSFLRREHSMLL